MVMLLAMRPSPAPIPPLNYVERKQERSGHSRAESSDSSKGWGVFSIQSLEKLTPLQKCACRFHSQILPVRFPLHGGNSGMGMEGMTGRRLQ